MIELADLMRRVAEIERRLANLVRHGTVEQLDAEKHLVRLRIGEGDDRQPLIGPWVPYGQIAGDLKVHTPPTKGQQMTLFNPAGDFRQAVALPLTWSDQNPAPSKSADENVLTYGSVTATLKEKSLEFKVGDARVFISDQKATLEFGGNKVVVDGAAVRTVGLAGFGLDSEGDDPNMLPKIVTEAGPAKLAKAKV